MVIKETCPRCDGARYVKEPKTGKLTLCPHCRGKGFVVRVQHGYK